MTLTFKKMTFQWSRSVEQLGNLSDVALSTLFSNPIGPDLVDFLSNLTLDIKDDLDLNKRSLFRFICIRISRF